jgi:thioester reductase-like protein/acyl carrier protein
LRVILSVEGGVKSQKQLSAKQPQPATTALASTPGTTRAPAPPTSASKDSQVNSAVINESHASSLAKVLAIVAEESGLSVADLTDNTVFSDVGIDSLLGLTISARFNEDLDLDLDFNALLSEYPTVAEFTAFFGGGGSGAAIPVVISTPTSSTTDSAPSSIGSAPSTHGDTPGMQKRLLALKFDFKRAVQIISEESGVAPKDLTDDTNFADAGVDSLLSLVIVSRFRDELELDIKHESLFLECPTVAELKTALLGGGADKSSSTGQAPAVSEQSKVSESNGLPQLTRAEVAALAARERAVDELVRKYTVGFFGPPSLSTSSPAPKDDEHVVLLTGATGSLGSHLAYHVVQLPEVKTVVCLNRQNREEPYKRQIKAMRDKGIRFPEALKPKLLVFQTDTSKPMLGLGNDEYKRLVGSVTHVIHSAWPMSAKRALDGFESQFQAMKSLIQLACDVASQRPPSFKFSFQMVSSIGAVGHYGRNNGKKQTLVPEERFGIESVLPNGYGDAKWGCERMIDETLHKYPDRFRAMVVRLGQIAGSKTSGYWNPMEHFGFLIKSSQTLKALPDVPGTVYWTPVNDIANTLAELALSDRIPYQFYHIENPVGQTWSELNAILADALNITDLIPFEEWVERVRSAPQRNNPAAALVEFLDDNYLRMSCGGLVLEPKHALEHSKSLNAVGPVSEEVVRKYIQIWKEIGFLS